MDAPEVAKNRCKLNGPWTQPPDRNVQRVLAALGVIPPENWNAAAESLYKNGSR